MKQPATAKQRKRRIGAWDVLTAVAAVAVFLVICLCATYILYDVAANFHRSVHLEGDYKLTIVHKNNDTFLRREGPSGFIVGRIESSGGLSGALDGQPFTKCEGLLKCSDWTKSADNTTIADWKQTNSPHLEGVARDLFEKATGDNGYCADRREYPHLGPGIGPPAKAEAVCLNPESGALVYVLMEYY